MENCDRLGVNSDSSPVLTFYDFVPFKLENLFTHVKSLS